MALGSVDLFRAHVWVLTEPLFLTGVLGGLWWIVRDLERPRGPVLAGAAAAIALASLTRYAGLAAIATGALAIVLWSPLSPARRWGRAAIFAAAAGIPLLAWLVRNRAMEGTLTGKELVVHMIPGSRARQGLDSISAWLVPEIAPRALRYSVLILAACAVLTAWRYARGRAEADLEHRCHQRLGIASRVFGLFALLYGSLVFATITLFDAQVPLDGRLLTPLYAAAVVLAMVGVARLSARVPRARAPARWVLVLLVGVSLTRTVVWAAGSQLDEMGYASRLWRESALVAEVKTLRDDLRVFSNAPDALSVLTGRPARLIPLKADPFTRRHERALRRRSGPARTRPRESIRCRRLLPLATLAVVSALGARAGRAPPPRCDRERAGRSDLRRRRVSVRRGAGGARQRARRSSWLRIAAAQAGASSADRRTPRWRRPLASTMPLV